MGRDVQKKKKKNKEEKSVYKSVKRGKLNLKSGKFKKCKGKSKKQKKIKKVRDIENNKEDEEEKKENDDDIKIKQNGYKAFKSDYEKAMEELTDSERRFLQRQKMNESHFVMKQSEMTHRQRIEKYNNDLADLPEHHDVPKVGPG